MRRALAILVPLLAAQTLFSQNAMVDGVTLWIYDVSNPSPAAQEPFTSLPVLDPPTQTPNYYKVFSDGFLQNVDFTGPWTSSYSSDGEPDLANFIYGRVWGNIKFATSGTYEFRLTTDDGAKFFVNSALVIDNDLPGLNTATAALSTLSGSIPFEIKFYQNGASSRLLLEWKPPGESEFVPVPADSFETEDGQTLVTSPGKKTWTYADGTGGTPGGPGDGKALIGVHPSFTLGNFRPSDFTPKVGGLDFLPDGRLVLCTWDEVGAVYLVDNLHGPGEPTVSRFASGLGEPLGLKVVDGQIYVSQKCEVTKLVDTDDDGIADEYESIAHGWPMSFNYHEFTFNLCHKDGDFWITTSTPLKTAFTTYLDGTEPGFPVPDGPGTLIRINEAERSWEIVATGLRTPNGMGIGIDGELFAGDNQGAWTPTSKLNHLRAGYFFGAPQDSTVPETPALPDGTPLEYSPPAVWLPHGRLSNSPTQPVEIPTGTYAGQMLVAELTNGGINRVFMEKINGQYQGAAFAFTQGLESGINRIAWGPDGSLYLGGIGSNGNWAWLNSNNQVTRFGLQRLTPNGNVTFEIKSMKSRADGFVIEFTQPVPASVLNNISNYTVQQWYYEATIGYGGPPLGTTTLPVAEVRYSQDRKKVFLRLPTMQTGRVTYLRLANFVNDSGVSPWITEAWYTLNHAAAQPGPDFEAAEPPPPPPPPAGGIVIYEAESALLSGPEVQAQYEGHTGTGYADYPGNSGTNVFIEWTVETPHAGVHPVIFRYANGASGNGSSRPLMIAVNGATVIPSLAFPPFGWGTWSEMPTSIFLNKGTNTIRAVALDNVGPNIDNISVNAPLGPPQDAIVLYDGTGDGAWVREDDGAASNWHDPLGYLEVNHSTSSNHIVSSQKFKDFTMHAEFMVPSGGTGETAGNSGVKLQRRYEIQILNTPQDKLIQDFTLADAGCLYGFRKPDHNAGTGPGTWQSYDMTFTAPRWSGNQKVSNARVTVYWNGVLVHDDVEITGPSGNLAPAETPGPDGILLEQHASNASGEVRFRNIWVVPGSSFQQSMSAWYASYDLEGEDAEPNADWDRDGLVNIWEYAVGSNPKTPSLKAGDIPLQPVMSIHESESGNRFFEFTFPRRIDFAERGLYFAIQTSPELAAETWTTLPSTEIGDPVPTGDGITELVTLRVTQSIALETTRMFTRVKLEMLE